MTWILCEYSSFRMGVVARRCLVGTIDRVNDPGNVFQRSHKIRPADASVADV